LRQWDGVVGHQRGLCEWRGVLGAVCSLCCVSKLQ
jgi:hypothetical protein